MGSSERDKGNRGQREAECVLVEDGWEITKTSAGRSDPDFVAVHPTNGRTYAIEVKNVAALTFRTFRKQARGQAKRGQRWLLMCRIPEFPGTWYVESSDRGPRIWRDNGARKRDGVLE